MNTPGERLQHWIRIRYGGHGAKKQFAQAVGMNSGQLSRYTKDRLEPGRQVRLKFAKQGLNLHWYDTGLGPMQAPTKEDEEFVPRKVAGKLHIEKLGVTYAFVELPAEDSDGIRS